MTHATPAAANTPGLPDGEFDLVASIRLEKVDELLAAAYATHAWPHELPRGTAHGLIGTLRRLSDDIPDGDDIEAGSVHLTGPPTVRVGPENAVRISQPVRIDVDAVPPATPRRTTVTSLSGTLHYDAAPGASEPEPGCVRMTLDTRTSLGTDELEVAADSPIQPRDPAALAAFNAGPFALVMLVVRAKVADHPITICPDVRLPFDRSVRVRILAARAVTRATEIGNGALHVGALVGFGDDVPTPDVPELVMAADPFRRSGVSVLVSVHRATMQAAASALKHRMEQLIKAKVPVDVVVDGVTVALRAPDGIRCTVAARLPDFCGPGPFNLVDVNFDITANLRTRVVDGDVRFEGSGTVDFSDADLAACVISAPTDLWTLQLGDALRDLLALGGLLLLPFADVSIDRGFNGIFDPGTPIPWTEVMPLVETLQAVVTADRVTLRGELTLLPADDFIFGYVSVREAILDRVPGAPIAGATVELLDQDFPRPPGDDFTPPVVETPVILRGRTRTIRLDRSFMPARTDETVATATTDVFGVARLVADRRTAGGSGGTLVTRRTVFYLDHEQDPTTTTSRVPVREELPDIYLRVTVPDGRTFDSRRRNGISVVVNLASQRVGSPQAPIVILVPPRITAPDNPTLATRARPLTHDIQSS